MRSWRMVGKTEEEITSIALHNYYKIISKKPQRTDSKFSATFVTAKIERLEFPLMVDTGSNYSIMSLELLNQIKIKNGYIPTMEKNCCIKLTCGVKQNMHVYGFMTLMVVLSTKAVPTRFIVADISSTPCILGLDFLLRAECLLDYNNKVLLFADYTRIPLYGIVIKHTKKHAYKRELPD